jgi:hypothetical protein
MISVPDTEIRVEDSSSNAGRTAVKDTDEVQLTISFTARLASRNSELVAIRFHAEDIGGPALDNHPSHCGSDE